MTHSNSWWPVELPPTWSGHEDDICTTFFGEPRLGVLQISSARKEGPVSDQELRDFVRDRVPNGQGLEPADFGVFSGFSLEYREKRMAWRHWWLRSGDLVVYASYNVAQRLDGTEDEVILGVLASLTKIAGS